MDYFKEGIIAVSKQKDAEALSSESMKIISSDREKN